ncbi:hypothetical protein XCR_3886 [Xanthomonas campestris pv. raphani 756C]|nr:hypothetical protein XCR_3886 [Xanthomonas campestris pv. raphani 756C]
MLLRAIRKPLQRLPSAARTRQVDAERTDARHDAWHMAVIDD